VVRTFGAPSSARAGGFFYAAFLLPTRQHGLRFEPLEEQKDLWDDDVLGLRLLNDTGRLIFSLLPGGHLEFPSKQWFADNVVLPYLG